MSGKLIYNENQRREYLSMIDRVGMRWLDVFEGNTEFYSAAYWDLLTGTWKQGGSVRKTDAAKLMVGIKSAQTAAKYVESAIEHGFLEEKDNPKDARSKLVELSADIQQRLDLFFDKAVGELRQASHRVAEKGPLPNET